MCLFSLSLADFLIVTLHFAWGLDWVVYLVNRDESKLPVLRFFINNYIIGLYARHESAKLRHRFVRHQRHKFVRQLLL